MSITGNHVVVDQSQQQQPLSQPGSMSQTQFLGGTMQQAGVVQQTSQQPVQPQQQQQSASQVDLTNKLIPLQITVPTQGGSRILTIEVPASALQGNFSISTNSRGSLNFPAFYTQRCRGAESVFLQQFLRTRTLCP